MKKIQLGDIFELKTPNGNAYLHYVYEDKTMCQLVRVLQGLHAVAPVDFSELAASKERFVLFFPLVAARNRKIVTYAGHYPAEGFSKPKYMRTEHNIRGEFLGWHIVDTDTWKHRLVKTLTDEERGCSPWGIWNDTLLIERLTEDWSLDKWDGVLKKNGLG
ncbi:MAG TPA: hypothetical protein VD996_16215 [Chitinophagaceae bacterium]|nr:hypothetical protein [Chitinophagaceae bacterium]